MSTTFSNTIKYINYAQKQQEEVDDDGVVEVVAVVVFAIEDSTCMCVYI